MLTRDLLKRRISQKKDKKRRKQQLYFRSDEKISEINHFNKFDSNIKGLPLCRSNRDSSGRVSFHPLPSS